MFVTICVALVGLFIFLWFVRTKSGVSYLNGVDSMFINQDPKLRAVIHVYLVLRKRVTFEAVKKVMAEQFVAKHPRFKECLVRRNCLWHYYENEPDFDINNHVFEGSLPAPANHQVLQEHMSRMFKQQINPRHPLWEMHVYNNYEGNRTVCLLRVHHCLGDGIGLMRVALTCMSPDTDPANAGFAESKSASSDQSSAAAPPSAAQQHQQQPQPQPQPVQPQPKQQKPSLWSTLCMGVAATAKLLLLPSDPVTPLRSDVPMTPDDPVNAKWLEAPLALSSVKRVAKSHAATVNDVLFALVSGALRKHLLRQGWQGKDKMQAVLWVSLIGTDIHETSKPFGGNQLGAAYLSLPVETSSAEQRLIQVQEQTGPLRRSPEPVLAALFMRLFGVLPAWLSRIIVYAIAFKVTISMSNVPGPQQPLVFAGGPMEYLIFFVPPSRTISTFITILSYNGRVYIGMAADQRLVKPQELEQLVEGCRLELEELEKASATNSTTQQA